MKDLADRPTVGLAGRATTVPADREMQTPEVLRTVVQADRAMTARAAPQMTGPEVPRTQDPAGRVTRVQADPAIQGRAGRVESVRMFVSDLASDTRIDYV